MTNKIPKLLGYFGMITVLILFAGFAYFLYNPFFWIEDKPPYAMTCEAEEAQEIREEWVRSDNITSYEDIPKNQTENMPQRIRDSLKADPSFWLTATKYENLSEKEKEVFRRGLNGTRINRNKSIDTLVIYQGDVYYCDTDRVVQGA